MYIRPNPGWETLEFMRVQLQEIERLDAETREANVEGAHFVRRSSYPLATDPLRKISENEYTIYSVEDLSFDLRILQQSIVKKSAFIENQIVARGVTNITPQQLEEYSEVCSFCNSGLNAVPKP